jgi:hypothetical protein
VLDGLREVSGICTDLKSFTRRVNDELRAKWEATAGARADFGRRIAAIDKKVENIRRAVEDGLQDAAWANRRLRELLDERQALVASCSAGGIATAD